MLLSGKYLILWYTPNLDALCGWWFHFNDYAQIINFCLKLFWRRKLKGHAAIMLYSFKL